MKLKNKKYLIAAIAGSLLVGSLATTVAVSCSKEDKSKIEFASEIKLTKDSEGKYYGTFRTKGKKEDVSKTTFSISQNAQNVMISKPKNIKEENQYIYFDLKLPISDDKNDVKLIVTSNDSKFEKYSFNLSKEQLLIKTKDQSSNKQEDSQDQNSKPSNADSNSQGSSESNNQPGTQPEKPVESQNTSQNPPATNEQTQNPGSSSSDQDTKPSGTDTDSQGSSESNNQPGTQPEKPAESQNTSQNPPATNEQTQNPGSSSSDQDTKPSGTDSNSQGSSESTNQPSAQPNNSAKPATSSNGSNNTVQLRDVKFSQSVQNDPIIQIDFFTNIQIDYSTLDTVKVILEDNTIVDTSMSQNHGSNQYSGTAVMPTTNTTVKIKGIKFTHSGVENTYMLSEADSKTFTVKAS